MATGVSTHPHELIRSELKPYWKVFASCRSSAELRAHPDYRRLEQAVQTVLTTADTGDFSRGHAPAKARYRVVAWNIERGKELDGQLDVFRSHQYLSNSDVVLITEADAGMVRSGNRDVTRELADALGFHYAFAPCYLSLVNGSGVERHMEGENDLGLHGNAILSRYPIKNLKLVRLRNGIDKMRGNEKRLGSQTALIADIECPNGTFQTASIHLDAQSTQRHRHDQMQQVLDQMNPTGPAIIGGDWNTSTYNSSHAFHAIAGFWLRVFMGPDNVIRNHYLHPYRRFERELFELLEKRGFGYGDCNLLGERTLSYSVDDAKTRQALGEWVPGWCFAFIRWSLRNHGGSCPVKLDWFASRELRCSEPAIIHDVREGRDVPLSDHDAIGVDISL